MVCTTVGNASAEGAHYETRELALKARNMKARGQVCSAAKRVAPGLQRIFLKRALKVRNINLIIPLFQSFNAICARYQGRRASHVRRLPLAFIFRAFGADESEVQDDPLNSFSKLGLASPATETNRFDFLN
jgi:hypothetical protein